LFSSAQQPTESTLCCFTQRGGFLSYSKSEMFISLLFVEIACVLVRFDHAASRIVNANHGIM